MSSTEDRKIIFINIIFHSFYFSIFFLWSKQYNDMKKYKIHRTFLFGGGVSYYDIEQIPTLALKTTSIQMENLQLFTFILIMKTRFP